MNVSNASEKMGETSREWLEVVMSLPDGSQRFQRELVAACATVDLSADRAIVLAYTALAIVGNGQAYMMESWFQERARELLRRAVDVIEAEVESRQAGAVN
jgi:hypothetical protein